MGEEEYSIFNLSLEELLKVKVTSVSKKAEPISKAPAKIVVITDEDIKRRGYIDLEQVLHDLSGFDISRGNGVSYANIYQRGYRSNNTDRTLFLIDGVEENDLWKGTAWISRQYPLSNIKRIEIIHGPASTMYGANAFNGVINVIIKDPQDLIATGESAGFNAIGGFGAWNTRFIDFTFAAKHQALQFSVTGRVYKSDEMKLSNFDGWRYNLVDSYDLEYYQNRLATTDNTLSQQALDLDRDAYYAINPSYSNTTDDWLIYFKLKYNDFTFGMQTWERNEGTGAWYLDYRLGPDHNSQWVPSNSFLYAKYETALSAELSFSIFSRYKEHTLDGTSQRAIFKGYGNNTSYDLHALTNADGPLLPAWQRDWSYVYSNQFRNEIKFDYVPNKKIDMIIGFEHRYSKLQGNTVRSTEPNPEKTGTITGVTAEKNHFFIEDLGFFAQANYSPDEELKLTLGGRFDNNSIKSAQGFGTVFNARAAVVYTPSPFIFKAIYSEAFKDADNWSKFSTTSTRLVPNPNLKPEEVENFELIFGWTISAKLSTELSVYRASYSDIIGEVPFTLADGSQTNQNQPTGSLKTLGLQGNSTYAADNYFFRINYTYTDPQNTAEPEDIRVGDIAKFQFNIEANATYLDKWNVNVRLNYVGDRETGENTTINLNPNNKVNSYFVVNTAISYDNILSGLSAQLIINNLFDKEYFHPGVRSADNEKYSALIPQNERNLMLKITYQF